MEFVLAALLNLQDTDLRPSEAPTLQAPGLTPRFTWWRPALKGRVGLDGDLDDAGPTLCLQDDLSLGEREGFPFLEISLDGLGIADSLRGVAFLHEWSASGLLEGDHAGNEVSLPGGTPLDSRLNLVYVGLDGLSRFAGRPDGFSAGYLVGWRYYRESLEVDTPSGTLDDKAGGCGVGCGLWTSWRPLEGIALSGELSGYAAYGAPVAQAHVAAGLEWGRASLDLGFRGIWIDGEVYDTLRLSLKGPSLAFTLRF